MKHMLKMGCLSSLKNEKKYTAGNDDTHTCPEIRSNKNEQLLNKY